MPAGAGVKVTGADKMAGPGGLADLLAGPDADEALRFYRDVLGLPLPPDKGAGPAALGPMDAEATALAGLILAEFGRSSTMAVRARLAALRVLAASRVRAMSAGARGLRQGTGEVELRGREAGFAGYFAVEVARLTHRRFDGRTSPVLRREIFLTGDAVTVLPYDPERDRVLVIEQLRMGPLGRGDPLPWQIEAIAGRIDPGESPEAAARREAVEEAGLSLGRLETVGEYYPSPGALSEYIYSYVALCDLPDEVAGIFGAEAEAEDIRGLLLSHAELMAALSRGEIGNAPLMLTALWLDRERDRLRKPGNIA